MADEVVDQKTDSPYFLIILSIACAFGIVGTGAYKLWFMKKGIFFKSLDYYRQKFAPALNETTGFLTVSFIVIMCIANIVMKTAPKYLVSVDKDIEDQTTGFVEWLSEAGLTWIPTILPIVIVSVITILPFESKLLKIGLIGLSLLGVFVTALFFGILKNLFEKKKESFGHTEEKFLEDGETHPIDMMVNKDLGISITTEGHKTTTSKKSIVKNINIEHWNDTANIKADQTGNTKIFYSQTPYTKDKEDATLQTLEDIDTKGKDLGRTISSEQMNQESWKFYFHKIPNNIYVFNLSGDNRYTLTSNSYCVKDVATGLWTVVPKGDPRIGKYYDRSNDKWSKEVEKISVLTRLNDTTGTSKGNKILFWGNDFYTAEKSSSKVYTIPKADGGTVSETDYTNTIVPKKNWKFGYVSKPLSGENNGNYYFYKDKLKTEKNSRGSAVVGQDNDLVDDADLSSYYINDKYNITHDNFYVFSEKFEVLREKVKDRDVFYFKNGETEQKELKANHTFISYKIQALKKFNTDQMDIINNNIAELVKDENKITETMLLNTNVGTETNPEYNTYKIEKETETKSTTDSTDKIGYIRDLQENELESTTGLDDFEEKIIKPINDEVSKSFLVRVGGDNTLDPKKEGFETKRDLLLGYLTGIKTAIASIKSQTILRLKEINKLLKLARDYKIDAISTFKIPAAIRSGGVGNFPLFTADYNCYYTTAEFINAYGNPTKAQNDSYPGILRSNSNYFPRQVVQGHSGKINNNYNPEFVLRKYDNATKFTDTELKDGHFHFVRKDYKVVKYSQEFHEDTWYKHNSSDGSYTLYDYTDVDDKFVNGFPVLKKINGSWGTQGITKFKDDGLIFFRWGGRAYKGSDGFNEVNHNQTNIDKNKHKTLILSTPPDKDYIVSQAEGGSVVELKDQKFIFKNQLKAMEGSFNASYFIYYASVWGSMVGYLFFNVPEIGLSGIAKVMARFAPFIVSSLFETGMVLYSHRKYIQKSKEAANIEDVRKITPIYSYAVGAYATRIATVVGFLSYILTHAKEG